MFGNYQNNHRGGWNNMAFNGFNQGQFNHRGQFPHVHDFHYAYNGYPPPHQASGPAIPTGVPPHPHYQYLHYAYNGYPQHRVPQHQAPRPTIPTVAPRPRLPHNRYPSHQAPQPTNPAAVPPSRTLEPTIPAIVSQHQTLEPTIPAIVSPHQTPEPTIPAIVSPHQTPEPTIPDVAPLQLPPKLVCEICNVVLPRGQMEEHKKGRRHRRTVQEQIENLKRQKTSNGHKAKHTPSSHQAPRPTNPAAIPPSRTLEPTIPAIVSPHQTLEPTIPAIVSPHQTPEPIIPDVAPIQLPPKLVCEICDVVLPRGQMEEHKKGRRHRRTVQQQIENLKRQNTSNGHKAKHTPSSQMSPIVQPKNVPRTKENKLAVKNVSFKGPFSKFKNSQMDPLVQPKKVLKSKKNGCQVENVNFKGPFFNSKFKEGPIKGPERKHGDNTGEKDWRFEVEIVSHEAPILKNKKVPTIGSERKPVDNFGAKDRGFKRKIGEAEVVEGKYMKMNKGIRKPMISSKPEVNALSISAKSLVEVPELTPSSKPVASATKAPTLVAGSSEFQVSKGEELHEIQNPTVVGSSFEPQTELVLHTQTEREISDAEMNVIATDLGITQLSQVSVCLKCGDEGFSEALVYCNKCEIYPLHRYCLDGPVVISGDVTWFCEDCEERVVDTISNDQCSLLQENICESKVVEISSHDQCNSENSAKDASEAILELTNCIENKQQNQHIAAEEEKEFKKDCQPIPENEADSDEGCVININPQPIADPIWGGNLHLSNQSFGTITGILAHVSSLACSNVLKEASLFPHVLSASLLQRSAVWPKSFAEFGPDHNSIGLYFFPETERVERAFDNLVDDMISKDLAITTMVENAELLIFPSTVLPIQYRRFQAKYYLWGVFKGKKTSPNTKDVVYEEDISATIKSSPSNTMTASGSPGSSCASNH